MRAGPFRNSFGSSERSSRFEAVRPGPLLATGWCSRPAVAGAWTCAARRTDMGYFKGKLKPVVSAGVLALGAASAHASLVLLAPEDFSGSGLGSANTILTINSPANTSFEAG